MILRIVNFSFIASATLIVVGTSCKSRKFNSSLQDTSTGFPAPMTGSLTVAENNALWSKYCIGAAEDVSVVVNPNYSNPDVKAAATVLNTINAKSFYFYSDLIRTHKTTPPTDGSVTATTHNFLTYLCGEFRDRATMIEAKLNWVKRINYLKSAPTSTFDVAKSPWQQMVAADYPKFVSLSQYYYDAKQSEMGNDASVTTIDDGDETYENTRYITIGSKTNIDRPVPATTICKVKYMFSEYVRKNKTFDNLKTFRDGYKTFKTKCTAADTDYYYDFRGDSNFKPNSPESNGMIWFSKSIAKQCQSRVKAREGALISDNDCRRYFEQPFTSRFHAARAGLGAWLLRSKDADAVASNTKQLVTVVPVASTDSNYFFGDKAPFKFRLKDVFGSYFHERDRQLPLITPGTTGTYLNGYEAHWNKKDFGFSELATANGVTNVTEFFFNRIHDAVDRHTDWYASGWDNGQAHIVDEKATESGEIQKRVRGLGSSQAYSPFVASSYEMSASDGFTSCGVTVPCVDPTMSGIKQWMFVFKVHKSKWVTPVTIAKNGVANIDFNNAWFDETSFGDTHLANHEKAWDRLGTTFEDEHADILYLWDVQ